MTARYPNKPKSTEKQQKITAKCDVAASKRSAKQSVAGGGERDTELSAETQMIIARIGTQFITIRATMRLPVHHNPCDDEAPSLSQSVRR